LKRFYINRYNKADIEKDRKIELLTNSPEKEKRFEDHRNAYHNEAIADLVRNTMEQNRIIETNGKLVQKIYPVYKDPDPDHVIDFDAQFYMPQKHFLNKNIDTYWFNLGVMWCMSFLLALALYWEVLRKIIAQLSNLSN
ncbi:MAG: ABC transporter ATP-binding protein, partial [Flammeovirgaceae bacterium]